MKKLLFCFTLFLTIAASAQIDSTEKIKAFDFIDSALNKGDYVFEINDIEVPQEYVVIAQKYQQSIAANKAWFETYFNNHYKEGKGLPYHENLGITKEEFEKFKNMDTAQKQLKVISEQSVSADKNGGILTFESKSDFKLVDLIQVDVIKRIVLFAGEPLPFSHSFTTTATSPFGIWSGYVWRMEQTNESIAFNELTSKIVAVCFGKTAVNNKIVLRVTYKEVESGSVKGNLDIFGFLK